MNALPSSVARSSLLSATVALLLSSACASDDGAQKNGADHERVAGEPAAEAQAKPKGPPAGIGKTDDAALLGPFAPPTDGGLTVQGYKSSEANGTVNSWLLMGETDAALIDAQLVLSEGQHVADVIKRSGKNLKWVWITHGHPDHSTGLAKIVAAFPDAKVLAHPRVAENAGRLFEQYKKPLNRFFPGDIPEAPVVPTAHEGDTLELEGVTVKILEFEEGETDFTTALLVPSLSAVFAADMVYHRVHPWLNELRVDGVREHVDALDAMEGVTTIYPGHGEPLGKDYLDEYRAYLDFFMSQVPEAKDSNDLIRRVWAKNPDWRSMAGLRFSAAAHIGQRDKGAP
jgi:glyoxylase-like metal-dependent hydrolase (beta-lactamase superfamily II)